jgi:phage gpG-like protein
MITAKARTKMEPGQVGKAAGKKSLTSLGHAGAAIRLQARHSIKKSPRKSAAGTPPNTRKGRLRNAIKYAVVKDKQSVVIGPDRQVAGTSGAAHEFGGKYKRERYDRRPFMGPALEQVKDRLPSMWAGSVKG